MHVIKKSLLILILGTNLFSKDITKYKYDCPVPDILMQTIKLTENKSEHPFLIRTNDVNNLEKFERVIKRLEHSYPYKKDKLIENYKELLNPKSKNVNVNIKQSGENKKAKIEKAKLYAKNKNSFSN